MARAASSGGEGERKPSRRSALLIVLSGAAALIGGATALAAGFLGNALGRKRARPWLRIGPAEDLDAETFRRYVLSFESRHAWRLERRVLVVYVKDYYPDGDPVAWLATCSHLGCSVEWKAEEGLFRCPCHGGVYDEAGRVVSGPPPRGLTRLELKIEDEICYVRLPEASNSA